MGKLEWDKTGEKFYETGVNSGVIYPYLSGEYQNGAVWNGLTNVSESPEGAEITPLYADNIKYVNLQSAETFKATIEAYMYPDEFKACNGEMTIADGVTVGQQKRLPFGLSYKTKVGNDEDPEKGYKIHIIYGALAAPSERSYATVNDSPEAITFSWELDTTPVNVNVNDAKPTANLIIDSTNFVTTEQQAKLKQLENILYGQNHTLVETEPSDWATSYTNYYTKSGNVYTKVTGDNAPTWAANTYYTEETNARLPLPAEIAGLIGVTAG